MLIKNLKRTIKSRLRLPIYGNKTIRLAFEFGLVLSEIANQLEIDVTHEKTIIAEEILLKELKETGTKKTALNMVPLIMTMMAEEKSPE